MFGGMFEEEGDPGGEGLTGGGDASPARRTVAIGAPPLPRPEIGLCGIFNQGATCYLNSLIQTLLFTPEFREALFHLGPNELGSLDEGNKPGSQVRVIPIQLQHLFVRLLLANQQAVSTALLTDSFGWTNREELQQHDVQELNRILFSAIEDSLIATSGERLIARLYHGSIVNQIICQECGRVSEREESFLDLPVTVVGTSGVEESLYESFVSMEIMDGNNQYRCSDCKKLVDAKKGARLRSLPPVLTLSLLRFAYDLVKFERYKETGKFIFPLHLDMAKYCENAEISKDSSYELFSVVIHRGSTHGGHYHAYIRDIDCLGTWSHPDEEQILLPPDPESGKIDLLQISSPVHLLHMILYREGEHGMPVDKLCAELTKQTGVSWNKRFKRNNGPINKFLKRYSDVFVLNPDSNWVSLKTHCAPQISETSSSEQVIENCENPHVHGGMSLKDDRVKKVSEPEPETGHCWYDFDDSRVRPITEKEIEKQFSGKESAYMLFYRKTSMMRPNSAEKNCEFGVPENLLKMVEEENVILQSEREAYELKMNTVGISVHFAVNYTLNDGVLTPQPDSCHCMEMAIDRRKTVASLKEAITDIGQALVPDDFTIHSCQDFPAGLHLLQQISGDDTVVLQDLGIKNNMNLFIWDGKQVDGESVLIGEEFTPILLTVTSECQPAFCKAFPKSVLLEELRSYIADYLDFTVEKTNVMVSSSRSEELVWLSPADDKKTISSLGLCDMDQLIITNKSNSQDFGANVGRLGLFVQNRCKSAAGEDEGWPVVHVQVTEGATIHDMKKEILTQLSIEMEARLRIDDSNLGVGPPLHEDQLLDDACVKSGLTLVLEPGQPPSASQIILLCSSQDRDLEELEITLMRNETVGKCLQMILQKYGLKGDNWHLGKTNWCGEAAALLDDPQMTLDQCQLRNGEHILLKEGKLPPPGHLKLTIWLYPRPPALSSHITELYILRQQEQLCHPENTTEPTALGEVVISKDATLNELKQTIMTLPVISTMIIPTTDFLRVRKLEANTPKCVYKSPDSSLRKLKINSDKLCVQVLDYEEQLTQNQVLLLIQQRIGLTRSYLPAYEMVWDTSRGATFTSLQQTIADSLALPVERMSAAKQFPEKYEWLRLREILKKPNKQGSKKKDHVKDNLKQAPYHIKDGDTVGVKDLELDPLDNDDFGTDSDDKGKEKLQLQAAERRERREAQRKMNALSDEISEKFESSKKKPEVGIKIHVGKFT